jgi:putative ABC transport system permease protein
MVLGSWTRLQEPNSVVIDRAGYLLLFPGEPLQIDRVLEMNDHQVRIVGISEAGAPFASFPIIHARYSEAIHFLGSERSQMAYVLVQPEPGQIAVDLARQIERVTGLKARTASEFRWDCVRYYLAHTGIPVNFGITIGIALVIGLVVSGQTFYLFTLENLKQFAALKAMGVTHTRLMGMILLQALTAGFVGYALGTGLAAAFFETFSHQIATRGMVLYWQSAAGVAVLMLVVVVAASLLSIRRVLVLEPAAVFRG